MSEHAETAASVAPRGGALAGQPGESEQPLLRARGLSKRFGGLHAVVDVDLDLRPGHLLGLIGPNGAGKSTLINLLTGHVRPTAGTVQIDGRDSTGARPWRLAHAGVARTFQIVKPFRGMTVGDNVVVAALFRRHPEGGARTVAAARRTAVETLDRVGLGGKAGLAPAELSVADARRLELAKALALRPRVLLLDEVLAGLRPGEIEPALALIDSLRREGLALLMVEHVIHAIAAISDEVMVLHQGAVLTSGRPQEVLSDERVIAAYLGARYAAKAAARHARGSGPDVAGTGPAAADRAGSGTEGADEDSGGGR
jgi:branched-chain amino acid transport system ATP-binding protein